MKSYYQDNAVTIYHGDCREIVPTLGRFDLLLTDPPYGIGVNRMTLGNGRRQLYRGAADWDIAAPARWVLDMCREHATLTVLWGGNYFDGLPPARGWLVWDKGTGDNDFADAELAWTNLDTVVKKFFRSWVGANARDRDAARQHPTQKPIALMTWCIDLAGDVQTILDPFAGSGTTGRAAKDLGRKAVLIEREERYCEIAARRMAQEVLPLCTANAESENSSPAVAGNREGPMTYDPYSKRLEQIYAAQGHLKPAEAWKRERLGDQIPRTIGDLETWIRRFGEELNRRVCLVRAMAHTGEFRKRALYYEYFRLAAAYILRKYYPAEYEIAKQEEERQEPILPYKD